MKGIKMSQDVIHQAASGATGVGIGSGIFAFISQNTSIIALCFTAGMFFLALTFHILNYRINRKQLLMAIEAAEKGNEERRLTSEELLTVKRLLKKHAARTEK